MTWKESAIRREKKRGWLLGVKHSNRDITGSDIPDDFPECNTLFDSDEWINTGDAVVIKPFGGILAGPLHQEKELLYADIDLEDARRSRKAPDVSGHYNRPDLFLLEVGRTPKPQIRFIDNE